MNAIHMTLEHACIRFHLFICGESKVHYERNQLSEYYNRLVKYLAQSAHRSEWYHKYHQSTGLQSHCTAKISIGKSLHQVVYILEIGSHGVDNLGSFRGS